MSPETPRGNAPEGPLDYPPPSFPPPGGASPGAPSFPPPGGASPGAPSYPQPGGPSYPPPGYPGYPPPGYPGYPPPDGPGGPGGPPRQHAWHTPNGGPPPQGPGPPPRSTNQRTAVWAVVAVALIAILVRAHRITSTEVILFCTLIPSVILHEVAHGVVALAFGDDTAKRAGRLTLNPIRHVTVFGTIIVPFITIISGLGFFGWAKPVPVNVSRLRSPRNHGFLVALAGPFTNMVLAIVLGVVFYFAYAAGHPYVATTLGARILFFASVVNVWVACFNMIPIPPLDGSALVERLLPASWWPAYLRLRPYGMFIIFGAILLFSFTSSSPIASVFTHITTWWGHVIHAYSSTPY